MTWTTLLLISFGAWLQKAAGPVLAGAWEPPARVRIALHLLAVPVLSGLIVVQTFGLGSALVLDARAAALAVAGIAAWRGAPFLVTVLSAALVAAVLRAVG